MDLKVFLLTYNPVQVALEDAELETLMLVCALKSIDSPRTRGLQLPCKGVDSHYKGVTTPI